MACRSLCLIVLLGTALFLNGCGWIKDRTFSPTEAEKKLTAFCLKEGNINVITRRIEKTLWIYAPLEEPLFDIRPSRDKEKAERKVQPFSLLSLQGEFSANYFRFSLDVVPDVLSGEATTYGSGYSETYTKKRQLLYQALQESFFNAAPAPSDPMPDFIVVMVADITKGIATKSTFYLQDLKHYITEAIPPDEYYMRELNEIVGKEGLIGDRLGRNAPYTEVTWPFFLTEQIKTRIKNRFTRSDLPRDTDPAAEAAKASANTLRFYPFTDFEGVVLYNMRTKKEVSLSRDILKTYTEKTRWEETQGKLTTIRFQIPQDPSSGVATVETVPPAEDGPKE